MRFARISWRRSGALALLLALMLPILAACGGSAPATTAPTTAAEPTAAAAAPTTAPEPTAAAAAPTAAAEQPALQNGSMTETNGLKVASVTSCDKPYAGLIKEIAAVDA